MAGAGVQTPHSNQTFMVPAGWFYRVYAIDGAGNLSSVNRWFEVNL